ncbi:flagellar hook capping protein [Paenibacillus yonginensis]|uniref:Flagellar hook capping protein n=1 Tax=Paenibacillus yonginensis TaxID=1462996 RepID=A0A1B1MXU1_9BACL|nr:flagellar hook capping FlgD N-terminal domain-containing protein [Paenibacillus yonginensis]ANS74003.1 flagellar hook capping protein [Paenibacillus yonginensis]
MADSIPTNVSWPNYSASNVQTAAAKDTQSLGKDQFLKILITQLQNQDPMQPMEDKEFIAQMAQFTSVEQLVNISSQLNTMSLSLGSVSSLIGKEATWMQDNSDSSKAYVIDGDTASDDGYTLKGIIDGIVVRSGIQYAKIGSNEVPVTKILQIDNPDDAAPSGEDNSKTGDQSEQNPAGSGL